MINPTSYETYGERLYQSAESVTLAIGGALMRVWQRIILSPDRVHELESQFVETARQEARNWHVEWRDWMTDELARAYLNGVMHTEEELNQLRKKIDVRQPTKEISAVTPILLRRPSIKPPVPQKAKEILKKHPKHLTFYEVFAAAAYESLEGTDVQIVRASRDIYRDVTITAGEAHFKESDVFTRRQIAQRQLDEYAKRGLQAITYADGRRMSLDVYAEMVGRTMSGHAAIQASLNRYEEYGYDLVRVSSHFRACPMCTPWEGRILSQSGASEHYPSLDEAIGDGLFHPNCAHDINPYFPGLSPEQEIRVDPHERALIEEHGYEQAQRIAYGAQQKQRYIERNIRKRKRRERTSLSRHERAESKSKVSEWQKKQRKHLEENKFLPRKYVREQVKRAH